MEIPKEIQDSEFRFFLVAKNGKIPIEKAWNSTNNYPFFHTVIIEHLKGGGNIGICTGFGDLIVLDFDDYDFYKSVRKKLPYTYTTKTANKRCPHYYYYLKGEMIRKIGVDNSAGKRVLDIQANKCGIICPPSNINRKYYETHNSLPITDISLELITSVFTVVPRKPVQYTGKETTTDNEAVVVSIEILKHHKIQRAKERHFKCPFHESESGSSLHIFEDGGLYCFHCQKHWDIHQFVDEYLEWQEKKKQ